MGALLELAMSLGMAVGSNQVSGVNETVDPNKVFIGNYVITKKVTEDKWISIDSELDGEILEAADFSGRPIEVVNVDGQVKLFYLATPEKGIIKGYRPIYNDIDSFLFMIEKFYFYTTLEYDSDDINNDMMGYVRSFNSAYDSSMWSRFAGEFNTDFISAVDKEEFDALGFKEYFSSFVDSAQFNTKRHNTSHTSSLNTMLIDPMDTSKRIDLIHMFASIDYLNYYYEPLLTSRTHSWCISWEEIGLWAGDMHTELQRQYKAVQEKGDNSHYQDFEAMLSGANGSLFSESDFIADIDAYNIVTYEMAARGSLYQALDYYYTYDIKIFKMRYYQYKKGYEEHNWNNYETDILKNKVYNLMHLKEENGVVKDSGEIDIIKFHFAPNISDIPVSHRKLIADQFIAKFDL